MPTHRVDAFVTLYTNRRSPPRSQLGASSDPAQLGFPSTTATRACRSRKQVRLLTLCGPSQTGVRRRELASVDAAPCPWQLTLYRTCATVAAAAEFCPVAVILLRDLIPESRETQTRRLDCEFDTDSACWIGGRNSDKSTDLVASVFPLVFCISGSNRDLRAIGCN